MSISFILPANRQKKDSRRFLARPSLVCPLPWPITQGGGRQSCLGRIRERPRGSVCIEEIGDRTEELDVQVVGHL